MVEGVVEEKGQPELGGAAQASASAVPPSAPRWRSRLGFQDTPGAPAYLGERAPGFLQQFIVKEGKRLKKGGEGLCFVFVSILLPLSLQFIFVATSD